MSAYREPGCDIADAFVGLTVVHYDQHMVEDSRKAYEHPRTILTVGFTGRSGPVVFLRGDIEVARLEADSIVADDSHPWGCPGPNLVAGSDLIVSLRVTPP